MFELVGRDYFLSALDYPALRIRVLDQQPKTLDGYPVKATQMEGFSKSVQSSGEGGSGFKGGGSHCPRGEKKKNEFG